MSIGIQTEHEARYKDDEPVPNIKPDETPEEKSAKKLVDKCYHKAKKYREKYDKSWITYYKFFRGDQWPQKRPAYRHSEVFNLIFQTIQAVVPIMTDSRPRPHYTPTNPLDLELSEIVNDLFEADWNAGLWMQSLSEVMYDGKIFGTGASYLYFDPKAEFGLGRIKYESFDPLYLFPCPSAQDTNKKCQYIVTTIPDDIDLIKERYSGHKYVKFIRPDLMDLTEKNSLYSERLSPSRNYNLDMPKDEYKTETDLFTDKVLVTTLYIKPNDVEEKEQQQPDGTVSYITMKKYPKGRKIVKINDMIFEDTPLDNDDLKFPFAIYKNYLDPRSFWGISEVEQLKGPQQIFNKVINFVLDVLTYAGNPIWLVPTMSGVKPGSFHSAPGMQVPFDGERPPQRVEGAQLQPYVIQIIDRLETWFNDIAGTRDVTRGIKPPGVTANAAIENLQDAAQTRIREKMRHMDVYLQEVGQQWVQLALQHYTAPRVFRYTDKQDVDKYFKFWVEEQKDGEGQLIIDDKGDPVRIANIQDYAQLEDGSMAISEQVRQYIIRGSFDVKVNTTSGLPFSKAEKEQRLIQLFDRNVIDRKELLTQMEYPDAEAISERMDRRDMEIAQAQQQQQQ
jgi:hypothetical protein